MTSTFDAIMSGQPITEIFNQVQKSLGKSPMRASSVTSSTSSEGDQTAIAKKLDYIEKRKKNNDSARRSREIRRIREQRTREKMEELEKENMLLQSQIALLKLEYNQLVLLLVAQQSSNKV